MAEEILDIVDENDNVIGTAPRKEIHAKGLWHREVFIFYITPSGDVVFQRRSMTKETSPGLLTVTVGGHVTSGCSYEEAALREAEEETGLILKESDLVFLDKFKSDSEGNLNHRIFYGYIFHGSVDDLRVEPKDGDGFVTIPAKDIMILSEDMRQKIVPSLVDPERYGPLYPKLMALVQK